MKHVKFKISYILVLGFSFSSCQKFIQPEEVANNWTFDDKTKVGGSANIMIMMSQNSTLIANKLVICDCVVNESIEKYPKIEDFKNDLNYASEAFGFCLNKVDSLVSQ